MEKWIRYMIAGLSLVLGPMITLAFSYTICNSHITLIVTAIIIVLYYGFFCEQIGIWNPWKELFKKYSALN